MMEPVPTSQPRTPSSNEARRYVRYAPMCLDGLRKALHPETKLYDRQLRNARWESTIDTEDLTSTCICLIGVDRSETEPLGIGLDPPVTLDAAIVCAKRRQYEGGFGLLLWASAVWDGPGIDELAARTDLRVGDGVEYSTRITTMEASWLLSGLLHEQARRPSDRTRGAAEAVLHELQSRWTEATGLMPHSSQKAPLAHRVRRHIANFADQIYTVQAAAFASIVLGDRSALDLAKSLAGRLVELQGPLGQWWWHYDARAGLVAEPFPVYSVHQHAMAPMALMSVEAAGGGDFSEPIFMSHSWLTKNELGASMIDETAGTIWRDIEHGDSKAMVKMRHVRSLLGLYPRGERRKQPPLVMNLETRPYEWAWCLYAGAIANRTAKKRHLV